MQAYDSIMCADFCIRFIDFMLAGKPSPEFTNIFSPNNFKKWWYNFKLFYEQCLKMAECNSHNIYPNLSGNTWNEQKFRLNKINEIKELLQKLEKEN